MSYVPTIKSSEHKSKIEEENGAVNIEIHASFCVRVQLELTAAYKTRSDLYEWSAHGTLYMFQLKKATTFCHEVSILWQLSAKTSTKPGSGTLGLSFGILVKRIFFFPPFIGLVCFDGFIKVIVCLLEIQNCNIIPTRRSNTRSVSRLDLNRKT
jgi:hypothetical protein